MTLAASSPDDPRFPGIPPEVPFPPVPAPDPSRPVYPPVPVAPVPSPSDDLRTQVYEQLLARRTIMIDQVLDGPAASLVAAQLMSLDAEGTDTVTLVVNSPGGPLEAATAVLDTIDLVHAPIDTTCIGQALGTAVVVVAAGTGRRRIGAGARMRLRFDEIELGGSVTRLEDEVGQLRALRRGLVDRLCAITGQERQLVERDIDAGRPLSAEEARSYGLVDEVIVPGGSRAT